MDARQVNRDIWEMENTRNVLRTIRTMTGLTTGILRGPALRRLAEVQGVNIVFEDQGRRTNNSS